MIPQIYPFPILTLPLNSSLHCTSWFTAEVLDLVFLSVYPLPYLSYPLTAKLIRLRYTTFIMLLTLLLNICKDSLKFQRKLTSICSVYSAIIWPKQFYLLLFSKRLHIQHKLASWLSAQPSPFTFAGPFPHFLKMFLPHILSSLQGPS